MQYSDWRFKDNIDARQALIEARAIQQEILEVCRQIQSDRLDEEREIAADISYQFGKYEEERGGNNEAAIEAYSDCLKKQSEHKKAIASLAKLY